MTAPHAISDEALLASIDALFDFVGRRRIADFLDSDDVVAIVSAITVKTLDVWQARLVAPQRNRLVSRASESDIKLGAWLPADARSELETLLAEPLPLPPKMVDDAVASDRVRDEVRAMLQDTLSSFINKAVGRDDGDKGGLRGALGRGALGFAAAGKSLLGGIGEQVKKQLEEKVRDFVDGSVAAVQTRIADKLKSKETAENLGKRRLAAFQSAMEMTERDAAKLIAKAPHDRIDPLVPRIVAHNLGRPELRAVIADEAAFVANDLSKQTLGELLAEANLTDEARRIARARLLPLFRAFADSGALAEMLTRLAP